MHKKLLILIPALYISVGFSQVNPEEYLTAIEIFEKATDLYQNEDFDEAFKTFQLVNYNDTAYFDSRKLALQCVTVQDKYDTIINLCKEVLSLKKHNPSKLYFENLLGYAYLQIDKNQEALDHLNNALKEFPRSYLLRYNKSVALYELEKYSDAVKELQMSIRYNPKYFASHMQLGKICAEAGDLTKAALSMNMGLFLISTEKRAINSLTRLESVYNGESTEGLIKLKYREDEEFDEIDLMLKNKVAENSKYKVKVKLGYNFIKHNHLLFEKIEFDPESDGFWNQTYVRYFKEVFNRGDFANYSYYQCYSIDNSSTQNTLAKNKSKIITFIKWASDYLTTCMNERKVWDNEKRTYVDNQLRHIGDYGFDEDVKLENGKRVGPYMSFGEFGLKEAEGSLNDNGQLEGVMEVL